jgi:hypothetical protein
VLACLKTASSLDIAPYSLVEVDRRFTGAYCLHHVALMIDAISISETSVYFYETTRRYISESYHLHTRRRENLNLTR